MQHRPLAASLCLVGVALAGCASGQHAASAGPSSLPSALLSGGAGSAGPPDISPAGLHACKLIPAAVVTRVLGRLASPAYESATKLTCFYSPSAPSGIGPNVIVTVMSRSGFDAAKAFDQGASESGALRLLPASGVGDASYATMGAKGAPEYSLSAAEGGRAINIAINSTGATQQQQVRDLMTTALGNL